MKKIISFFIVCMTFLTLFSSPHPTLASCIFTDYDEIDDTTANGYGLILTYSRAKLSEAEKQLYDKAMKAKEEYLKNYDDCPNARVNYTKIMMAIRNAANNRTEICNNGCTSQSDATAKANCEKQCQNIQKLAQTIQRGDQSFINTSREITCLYDNNWWSATWRGLLTFGIWGALYTPQGRVGQLNTFSKIVQNYIATGDGCWFCSIFDASFDMVNSLATNLYGRLNYFYKSALALGGFAWILWIVLQFFVVLHGANIGEFMTNLFKAIGKIMIAAAFLYTPAYHVYGLLLELPVSVAGGLSNEILAASGFTTPTMVTGQYMSECDDNVSLNQVQMSTCKPANPNDSRFMLNGQPKALSSTIYDVFSCLLKTMSSQILAGMAIGGAFFVHSFSAGNYGLPYWSMLLVGACVFISHLVLYILFPLKLLDILVRMGFIILLLPLYIVFWVFPATAGYAGTAWKMLVSCLFSLLALTIMMVVAMQLITISFGGTSSNNASTTQQQQQQTTP